MQKANTYSSSQSDVPPDTKEAEIKSTRLIQRVLWFVPTFVFSAYVYMALHEGFTSTFKRILADPVSLFYLACFAIAVSLIHVIFIFMNGRLRRSSPALTAIVGGASGFLLLGVRRALLDGSGPPFARAAARDISELGIAIACLGFSIVSIFLLSSVYRKPLTD